MKRAFEREPRILQQSEFSILVQGRLPLCCMVITPHFPTHSHKTGWVLFMAKRQVLVVEAMRSPPFPPFVSISYHTGVN